MNVKRVNQYLILPENGQRKDTKLAIDFTESEIYEMIEQGYVIVNTEDFDKIIGNADGEYLIADSGTVYPKPAPTEEALLGAAKKRKIAELKSQRDVAEVEPIAYNENLYDYDEKARDRIAAAIIALELQGEEATIEWTTADNEDAVVTAQDLRMIIASVAARSNKLHTAYRAAKAKVEAASTAEEVEAVTMNN